MKKWLGVIGVMLVVLIAAPWGVGMVTEQQWQQTTLEVNKSQPYFTVETARYQRDLFGAEVEGTVHFRNPAHPGEAHQLGYRGEVSHGVTGSEITFYPDQASADLIAGFFPDRLPTVTLSTRLWGTVEIEYNVPAIDRLDDDTGESLTVTESYGWARISDAGNDLEVDLRWPGLVARGPEARFAVDDVRVTQTMSRLAGNVWTGKGKVSMARLQAEYQNQPAVVLEDFALQSDTSAEGDERFSSEVRMDIARIASRDDESGPYEVEFAMENMEVVAWNRLVDSFIDLRKLSSDQANGVTSRQALVEKQMNLMMNVSDAVKALAGAGMSVGIPAFSVATSHGEVSGNLMLRHPELSDDDRAAMTLVMQRLTGELSIAIPVALAEAKPGLMTELRPLIEQGFLVRDNDTFRLEAELKDLDVDLNGQIIPLPPMI
ncbi:DUF945 family protein [Marinobacter changyiensis]|uniref:DUF945 family protein n=1 Tax=Marinobacter changyiensis TaxID=2604091 RepID=UPI0015D18B6F|nr:DUF945 family protein [Marinobacter changyiensis]